MSEHDTDPMIDALLSDDADATPDTAAEDEAQQDKSEEAAPEQPDAQGEQDTPDKDEPVDPNAEHAKQDQAEGDNAQGVPPAALKSLRQRAQKAEAELARIKADQETDQAKPEPFDRQTRLDELQKQVDDRDADLTSQEAKEYGELTAALARHDAEQQRKAQEAKRQRVARATLEASINGYIADNPVADDVIDLGERYLSDAERKSIRESDNPGERYFELCKGHLVKQKPTVAKALLGDGSSEAGSDSKQDAKTDTTTGAADSQEADPFEQEMANEPKDFVELLAGTD
jgi:hypothetical protein